MQITTKRLQTAAIRSFIAIAIFLSVSTSSSGCNKTKSEEKPAEQKSKASVEIKSAPARAKQIPAVIARVNGQDVPSRDYIMLVDEQMRRFSQATRDQELPETVAASLHRKALDRVIDRELLLQAAQKKGVTVDDKELEEQIKKLEEQAAIMGGLENYLEQHNITSGQMKEDQRNGLIMRKYFEEISTGSKIDEADAQKYFNEHPDFFKKNEQIDISHILIKATDKDPPEKQKEAEKRINEIKREAVTQNFNRLADKYSQDPSVKRNHGDLGLIGKGTLDPEFEKASFAAPINTVIGPVHTRFGYHLIKVKKKFPAEQKKFAEVKNKIMEMLGNRGEMMAIKGKTKELRDAAKIEILIDLPNHRLHRVGQ